MQRSKVPSAQDARTTRFVVRSRFAWTFFGMGLFAAICLLFCGVYLLAEALREPLEASENVVLAGGFTLALASFLLTYLVWPRAAEMRKPPAFRKPDALPGAVLNVHMETAHRHTSVPLERASGFAERCDGRG